MYNPWDPPPPPGAPPPPPEYQWGGPPDAYRRGPVLSGPARHFNGPPDPFHAGLRKRKLDNHRPAAYDDHAKLYVAPVPRNVSKHQVSHFFQDFGNVIEVVLVTDKNNGQQQEYCFVKYASIQEAERAITALHNHFTFPGAMAPLIVKYADGGRKRLGLEHLVQQDSPVSRSGTHSLGLVQHDSTLLGPDRPDIRGSHAKLYAGPIPRNICQEEVRHFFEEFGNVIEVVLLTDRQTGLQREYCFVRYASIEEAERTITALHNRFTFPGAMAPLKVKYAAGETERLGLDHVVQKDLSFSKSGTHPLGLVQHDAAFLRPDRPDMNGSHAKLYVGPVPRNVCREEVGHLFEEFGHVIEVVLLTDKMTGQRQEYCFVKYASVEEAERSITALHNLFTFPGAVAPLKVKYAADGRNRLGLDHVQRDSSFSRSGTDSIGLVQHDSTFPVPVSAETGHKVYVNGLNREASKEEITEIFSSYGDVADIYIMRDESKQSRGCGFVAFTQKCMAVAAINGLNGSYMMRGCDIPLVVRFADPKKPKNGDFRPTQPSADMRRSNILSALHPVNSSTCTKINTAGEQGVTHWPVPDQLLPFPHEMQHVATGKPCHEMQHVATGKPCHEMQHVATGKPFSSSRLSQLSLQESQTAQAPKACIDLELKSATLLPEHCSSALSKIDYSEAFRECDWSEHICPDGDKYYFNCVTSESRWEKPEDFALCEQQLQSNKLQNQSRKEPLASSTLGALPSEDCIEDQSKTCSFEKPQLTVSCAVEHSHELAPVESSSVVGLPFVQ